MYVLTDIITTDLSADIQKTKLILRGGDTYLRTFRKSDYDEINEYITGNCDKKPLIADVVRLETAEERHNEVIKYHSATDIVIDMKVI